MTTRRSLILALGSGVLATPFASFAQQAGKAPAPAPGKIWRVGFLADNARPASIDAHFHGAFARGLRDLGYVEGKNLFIEWRYAENRPELLPALAAELVRLNVDVIVTQGSLPTQAAQTATSTIPIMFVGPGDPVGAGLVKSLARPGGNITGLSSIAGDLSPKRLELLLAMTATVTPKVSRVAMLVNPRAPVSLRCSARRPLMWTKSSRAPGPATCRSRAPPDLNWSSTARLPKHSGWPYRKNCCCRRTG